MRVIPHTISLVDMCNNKLKNWTTTSVASKLECERSKIQMNWTGQNKIKEVFDV